MWRLGAMLAIIGILLVGLMAAMSCQSTPAPVPVTTAAPEFGFRFPKNDPDVKLRRVAALAEQWYRHPRCRAEYVGLPDFPPGKPLVRHTDGLPRNVIARTVWSKAKPPMIYVNVNYLLQRSEEFMAAVLIHEQSHVASTSMFKFPEGATEEEVKRMRDDLEALADRVAAVCADAAGYI